MTHQLVLLPDLKDKPGEAMAVAVAMVVATDGAGRPADGSGCEVERLLNCRFDCTPFLQDTRQFLLACYDMNVLLGIV